MLTLIKFWSQITAAIAAALLVALCAWFFHSLSVRHLEARQKSALESLETSLRAECARDKQITEDISREYQNQLTDLNDRLSAARRMRASTCYRVSTTSPAGSGNGSGGPGHAGQDAVAAADLIDYAGDAERYRRQLSACQQFINRVWAIYKK